MADILHLIRIDATPDRVWTAISTAQGLRSWWTRDADLDGRPGGRGELRFPHYGRGSNTGIAITSYAPSELMEWRVVSSFHESWPGTLIRFQLSADADATMLHFTHAGFAEAEERFALFNTGWACYLVSLKNHVEGGRGGPNPDIDFVRQFGPRPG